MENPFFTTTEKGAGTGMRLARTMMQIRPDIPVILCTGFSAGITEKKTLESGIRAFLNKPVLKRQIGEIIRKVLDDGTEN